MKYTAKDIAEALHVSTATVSLVLNHKPGVSEARRREILEKIQELECDYLLKNETVTVKRLGFVVYKRTGKIIDEFPFFLYWLEAINRVIQESEYEMGIIYMNPEDEEERIQVIKNAQYDGLIIYAVEMYPENLRIFGSLDIPCVYMDNSFFGEGVDTVTIDNQLGIRQAIGCLVDRGHREIGYIKSTYKIDSFDERFDVYKKALEEQGLVMHPEYVMEVGYSEADTERDALQYLEQAGRLPTAFAGDNDLLVCRVVNAMKKRGIRIPEDVSVVGFDNRDISLFTEPKITTIEVGEEGVGIAAVQCLLSKLRGDRPYGEKIRLGTKLIVRDSVNSI
ncbi:LacI family DNA-binding transcriptional regulator [Extibacter muris]|uniref:LacI family DNA-binding transcriptional regulator n=1 Tax=Extibacter muris TaxID=1796622 RepID=UPI001D0820F3|nr:LacI family DNA-binding transcriptional regulator [Extibacter muris]BDF35304.1 LacI family transcriptional regulator [Lachnospiraceae bacterium]MCB6203807.1 LacI family transcriptional regulator [Extibacter muris]MCQ4665475.1 LacI family transcriptional regulator [Extibacter muris]MCQ4695354.1 LacI family transcriptional regulator [Extibacter muris]BDF39305.1 LacI family transcriptional regulator [Lachnospiraceae bacterium]